MGCCFSNERFKRVCVFVFSIAMVLIFHAWIFVDFVDCGFVFLCLIA